MSSYYKSKSKSLHVQCRVDSCDASILKQNYKTHLERHHPEEDSDDLRGKGQPKLLFSKKMKFTAS